MSPWQSWGGYPRASKQAVHAIGWRDAALPATQDLLLARGMGRSYGDSCLNEGHALLLARGLDRLVGFDPDTGVLECEAGMTLAEIIGFCVPRGWFLPVTPGTKFVTVGGAIANDVHGKNHERAGSFGNHVLWFELSRSAEGRVRCSRESAAELFRATIGGLGLTGLITVVALQLVRIGSSHLRSETIRFRSLEEFLALSRDSRDSHEFTVSWLDCTGGRGGAPRGLFTRGNWAPRHDLDRDARPRRAIPLPAWFPPGLLNRWTVKAFNAAYFHRQRAERESGLTHFDPFFYPLDAITGWNRMYGPRGFLQYQCVVPRADAGILGLLLGEIRASGQGSFLCVLKEFGDVPSVGMLSFPRPGITLALDFPNQGERTLRLLDRLDEIVLSVRGAIYPAKDARMSPQAFRVSFPEYPGFVPWIDRRFSSSFWRRVQGA